jgi:hypothetical protein
VKFISAKSVNPAWFCVLVLTASLGFTGVSMAQNQYYVNASAGSDSNDGSQARPWKTIQHADAALTVGSGGAIVHVSPGTYFGPITTAKAGTSSSARVVYISDTKWGAKVINSNWLVKGAYQTIQDFDLTSPAFNGGGIGNVSVPIGQTPPSFMHIIGLYIHDISTAGCSNGSSGINVSGAQSPSAMATDNWIIGNVIRHVSTPSCITSHGIYDDGPSDIVENNIISGVSGWAIHRIVGSPGYSPVRVVISNNTIFNNGGGILLSEYNNQGQAGVIDYSTISNNIIVNNGGNGSQTGFGLNYFHVTGTHNVVTNNLIYGNLPSDYGHHGGICTGGTPISGTDESGTAGGCPSTSPWTDASTAVTFVNFQSDTNAAPASNYDSDNYQVKAGSNAIQHGATNCASAPGLSPCVAPTDVVGVVRLTQTGSTLNIGAYEQSSATAGLPSAPTGLTAAVQ